MSVGLPQNPLAPQQAAMYQVEMCQVSIVTLCLQTFKQHLSLPLADCFLQAILKN